MEQWHQKLHNNTTPDDVVICQGLLDYIDGGLDIKVFWKTLNDNGIDKVGIGSFRGESKKNLAKVTQAVSTRIS
eukprot:1139344-Prorocentrum_minimum.AAC.2